MNSKSISRLSVAAVFVSCGMAVFAADKNGVSPQTISLPSGPGSVQGLGESFQPQLNSGSGSHSVPIQLPKGPAGFGPTLTLQYHTGTGNGVLGIGWKLSGLTMVSRNMDAGLPMYVDAPNGLDDDFDGAIDNPEEIDRFSGVDLEELLPLADGSLRSESEGTFLRYERVGAGWQARTKSGLRHDFGAGSASRIENGGRVFAWLLDKTTDLNGNSIEYRYVSDPDSPGQKYCKEICWAGTAASYSVVLGYDSARPDVHSDYRSGFEVRTALRLVRLDVIAQGVPPSVGALTGDFNQDGQPDSLIRRYELQYETGTLQSLLRRVTQFGTDGVTQLPSAVMEYTTWVPPDNVAASIGLSSGDPTAGLESSNVELIDMNQDGLPDLLHATSMSHRVHFNRGINDAGRLEWDTVGSLVSNAPGLNLGSTAVHLADHSADGESDLIHKVNSSTFQCFLNGGQGNWMLPVNLQNTDSWPLWPFENPGSRTLDTDHNRLNDILFTGDNSSRLWMMMAGGRYGREVALPVLSDGTQAFRFENPGSRIADVNGDRISDLVSIQSTRVVYWASCGRGNFDGPIFLDLLESLTPADIAKADFADINGDALSDLIVVRPAASPNGIQYRLNKGRAGFEALRTIVGLPSVFCTGTQPNLVCEAQRWADMNGSGSIDLLISHGARPPGTREQFLDFVPGVRPHLLRRFDNGLGLVTTMDYEPSVQQMVRAREAGAPWAATMPISIPVVSRITESDSRGSEYTREITYRDPHYDSVKQEFRGFALTRVREIGDASAPTKVEQYTFDTGVAAGCRKGMVLSQEVTDDAGIRFQRVENTVQHRILDTSANGAEVCFAFNEAVDTLIFEQTASPAQVRTEYVYDDFGNRLQENMHGLVGQPADEVFVETAFKYRPAVWLMDRPSRTTTRDGQGTQVAEELYVHDDRGNLLERRNWLNTEDRFIRSVRNEYDDFGNVTRTFDALDHSRSIVYDPILHTYPVVETVHLGTYDLAATADYDLALGTITGYVDFAGAASSFQYDALARITTSTRPGGASTGHTYTLGSPVSTVTTRVVEREGSPETFDTYEYYDGYGRKLGAKVEAEDGQWRFVNAVQYNRRKLEEFTWLPYFTSTHDYELPDNTMPRQAMGYDPVGRGIQMTNPDGSLSRTVHEPLVQHLHDENDTAHGNSPKTVRVDGLGRLVEVIERNGPGEEYHTLYAWNPLGNLVRITDAQNNIKSVVYDSLKRSIALSDPDRGSMTYQYDDVGNMTGTTDAKGQVISFAYDFANRLVAENYLDQGGGAADPVDVHYVYDTPSTQVDFGDGRAGAAEFTAGRLASVADLSGEEHRSYDARGNVVWTVKRIRDPQLGVLVPYTTGFAYDLMNRVTDLYYPDGDHCRYEYNSASFLESVDGGPGGQAIVTGADYEPTGLLSRLTFGNDVSTDFSYDNRDRLAGMRTVSGPVGELINYVYAYDPVSNITRITDGRPLSIVADSSPRRNTQLFLYDELYRLTQVKFSPLGDGAPALGQIDFAYDKIGNMISQTVPALGQLGHIADPTVNIGVMDVGGRLGTQNRTGRMPGDPAGPHALSATEAGGPYVYDDNGNLELMGGAALTWDFKDRLVRYREGDIDARYTYDHTGRRITKLISQRQSGEQTLYIGPNFEYRAGRAPTKYVFNGATRLARLTGTLDPFRDRVQRLWLFEGWNLLTVAVQSTQTLVELFGAGSRVYEWTGTDYRPLVLTGAVPVGSPLWVEVASARVVSAVGPYNPPLQSQVIPTGQNLLAWPRLEPFIPGEHLSSTDLRIDASDGASMEWRVLAPTLPDAVGDVFDFVPASTGIWITSAMGNMLLPGAGDDREVIFYHGDHLDSASVMTGRSGAVYEEVYYYPFGATRHTHEPLPVSNESYGFTQKERDGESDLHYLEARYLAAPLSRFITPDPKFVNPGLLSPEDLAAFMIVPQKMNPYGYVLNNPTRYDDPTGLEEDDGTPSPGDQVLHGGKKIINAWKDGAVKSFDKTVVSVWESDWPDGAKVGYMVVAPIPFFAGNLLYSGVNIVEGVMHIGTGVGRAYYGAVKSSMPKVPAPLPQEPGQTEDWTTLRSNIPIPVREDPPPPPGPEEIKIPQRKTPAVPRATPRPAPIREGSPCYSRSKPGDPLHGK